MFAPAGEGAHPAVSPLPVPATARELQAALRVRQSAGGSQLRPQHGDLCRAEEQLGKLPIFVTFFTIQTPRMTAFHISKHLDFMCFRLGKFLERQMVFISLMTSPMVTKCP